MPPKAPSQPAAVRFGSDAFDRALTELEHDADARRCACLVFAGGSAERGQEALAAVKQRTGLSVHEVDTATLVGDDRMQTQGSIREVFDNTLDGATILYFASADALFGAVARQERDENLDADALTPLDYLFERARAFTGLVILHVAAPAHVARARTSPARLVVEL